MHQLATKVVDECTLVDTRVSETNDRVYNYTKVLCHYGALVFEFQDACAEGDGERVFCCWRLMLPHFLASGQTKYSFRGFKIAIPGKGTSFTTSCSSGIVESFSQYQRRPR